MELKAVFSFDTTKIYNLVSGSVIKEEYNETLDSATLILTNISESDKPTLSPYDYVYVYDIDSDFKRYFLIDNYIESLVNQDEKIYSYSISCFSPTKLLEKIQLPNRTIIHVLDSDNKTPIQTTIREEVYKMCQLYIPRVKMKNSVTTWTYDYLIDFSNLTISTSDLYKKLDIDCPDFTWNKPTLREVLNSLFNVAKCLPIVSNRTLGFLDLDVDGNAFNTYNKNLDIKESLSSDSYVNELVVDSDNVIGEDNTIVSETLGFRNTESAIISTSNLELNTSYPIAEIKSFKMKQLRGITTDNYTSYSNTGIAIASPTYYLYNNLRYQPLYILNNIIYFGNSYDDITLSNVKLYEIELPNLSTTYDDVYYNIYNWVLNDDGSSSYYTKKNLIYSSDSLEIAVDTSSQLYSYVSKTKNTNYVMLTCEYDGENYVLFLNIENESNYGVNVILEYNIVQQYVYFLKDFTFAVQFPLDLTAIVKENSARKMLATSLGYEPSSLEDMATWYFTTLGYTYGDTKITGFSQKYNYLTWYATRTGLLVDILTDYFDESETRIESVRNQVIEKLLSISFDDYKTSVEYNSYVIHPTSLSNYALFTFDIEYQPMNSTIIKYSKQDRDIPFSIQQLDNQEASIPAFKSMSLREQEKINRLGNQTLSIHQSLLTDLTEINDLASKYNDSVVFSREIQYYDDFAEVNYTATKDYILKDYFTSIATKYRAYQYVDYNNTTLRKENTKKYLLIDEYYINADDDFYFILRFGNASNTGKTYLTDYFINTDVKCKMQCNLQATYENTITGEVKEIFRNEMSILTYDKGIALTFKDFDSVSGGIYYSNANENIEIGGWVQQWYIRDTDYNSANITIFTTYNFGNISVNSTTGNVNDLMGLPKIPTNIYNFSSNEFYNMWLERCLTYKSQDEVLSRTLQIEAYTTSSNILIGSDFMKYAPINNDGTNVVKWLKLSDFSLGIVNYSTEMGISLNLFENTINKGLNDIVGLCLIKNNKATPLLVINEGVENVYLSINATKTNKVYSINNGTGLLTLNRTLKVNENTKLLN